MKSFGSDNHSGIHPNILAAITSANHDHTPAYGDDPYTRQAQIDISTLFDITPEQVFFVFNGTGANCTGLLTATRSFNSIICADTAHINVDECGAPERLTGCKIIACPNVNGKLTTSEITKHLHNWGFEHHAQPRVISITQSSELGTLYTLAQIKELSELAHQNNMLLHMDGARFANAIASMGCSAKEMVKGVDILSFGGTKNGMMLGESVILLNSSLVENFKYLRKQSMQLCSKMRFIGAQFSAYLSNNLWLTLATNANQMATLLYDKVSSIEGVTITRKPESNAVFAIIPKAAREKLLEKYCFYVWDEFTGEVRWMCSFDTTTQDIETFASDINAAIKLR